MPGPLFERLFQWPVHGLVLEVFYLGGFVLAVFSVARLVSEKRASANTFVWLLGIVLIPWVCVPLYLMFGGRELCQLARRKTRIMPILPPAASSPSAYSSHPVARTVAAAGAYPVWRQIPSPASDGRS